MKKIFALLVCLACTPCWALSVSPEGRQEAALFNQFLKSVYALRNEDPNSYAYLQAVLRAAPDSVYLKRLLVLNALAMGDLSKAEPYADFFSEESQDADDFTVYASYRWKKGNLQEAEKAFARALELAPDNAAVLYQYVAFLSTFPPQTAVSKLLELAEKVPAASADVYASIAQLYQRRGQWESALTYYNKALQADPEFSAAKLGRAEVYEKTSQYFLMLHELEELEQAGYANAATYSRMASVFLLVKDFPKAKQYFLKAKADDNADVPSSYFLALLAEQEGDFAAAAQYVKDAEDYNQNAAKWLQVSFYQKRLNQPQESLKTLAQAYQKFDGNVEIAYFYALALNEAKSYKKAARVLEKILQTNPAYEEARLQYAFVLESLKKYRAMEAQIAQILKKNPQNAAALNLQAYSLAERGKRLDEAQEYVARALALAPQQYAFIDTQAWIYFKQGNVEKALNLLENIPEPVVEQNAEIAYHLGAVYAAQNRPEMAQKYLNWAKNELKPALKLYKKVEKNAKK